MKQTLGQKLKAARLDVGLSRRLIASDTGLSMKMVQRMEEDEDHVHRFKAVVELAHILNLDLDHLAEFV